MKFHPILFSTDMVRAILDGRKTQTRRVVKYPVKCKTHYISIGYSEEIGPPASFCPYGDPGDVLWVRESFAITGTDTLRDPNNFALIEESPIYSYKASNRPHIQNLIKWKPGIRMPKSACRLFLQITDIRVERLQDITEEDAIAEGVIDYNDGTYKNYFKKKGLREQDGVECLFAKGSYMTLWSAINGKESWNANPWVWAITFKLIDKPETFLS